MAGLIIDWKVEVGIMPEGNRMKRRILHTSDWHLQSMGDKACQSIDSLISLANEVEVDLVVIVGDLFDDNRVEDELVSFTIEQLRRFQAGVVILPGNHDCLIRTSVFERPGFWNEDDNIRLFRSPNGELLDYPDLGISLWGKSIDTYENDVKPMVGIPHPERNGRWHIALAHGYYVGAEAPLFPSYHITREEIVNSGWDYIALGHLINFRCVCEEPMACYSGSPSLTSTVVVVDFDDEKGIQITPRSI